MRAFNTIAVSGVVCLMLGFGETIIQAREAQLPGEMMEWRTWTDEAGNQVEAFLKNVRPDRVTIVRRDGKMFAADPGKFSDTDRHYISEWTLRNLPNPASLSATEFEDFEIPLQYEIQNVERLRPGPGEPFEPAAIMMVLDYHGILYDDGLSNRISVREIERDRFITPRDLVNALKGVPVEAEVIASWDPYARDHEEAWKFALNVIRVAISMDLPVIVGYRPLMEIDTLELTGVAVGYDRRNFHIMEPAGSRHPARFHLGDFKHMFAYAMILFPTFEPPVPSVEQVELDADFLNLVSAAIIDYPGKDASELVEILRERGVEANVQDVNRTDFRERLGKTRSFARRGGLPLVDVALDNASLAVVPQEYKDGEGFALIYGRVDDKFAAVQFFPDRSFEREPIRRSDLAKRWLTRINRTYRLDLIQILLPEAVDATIPPRRPIPPPPEDPPPDPAPPSPPTPPDPPEPPDPPGTAPHQF